MLPPTEPARLVLGSDEFLEGTVTIPGIVGVFALGTSKVNFRLAAGLDFGNTVDAEPVAAGGF